MIKELQKVEPTPNELLAEKLEKISQDPLFWFLKKEVVENSPFWRLLTYRLHEAQNSVNSRFIFHSNKVKAENSGFVSKLDLLIETRGGKEGKLNEDAIMIENLGDGRAVFAVFDGASSQAPIKALESHGISGAFYVSHLAAFGFPTSDIFQELSQRDIVTAGEFTRALNKWLYEQMSQVDGVDYNDVLTIPGMAATIVVVDFNKQNLSVASVADTVGIAHHTDGEWDYFTGNLNERFDLETMSLVKQIAVREGISIKEAAGYPEVKAQLATSFRKKINAPEDLQGLIGCGILNGMPELEHPGLIEEYSLASLTDLHQLVLCSDGALTPFKGEEVADFLVKLLAFKEKHLAQPGMMNIVKNLLDEDPDFSLFERLKHSDDASLLVIGFNQLRAIAFERFSLVRTFFQRKK